MSNAKRLHVHSVPLVVFAVAATVAIVTLGGASYSHASRTAFLRPLVKLAPTSNSMAAVQLNKPTPAEKLSRSVNEAIRKSNADAKSQPQPSEAVGVSVSGLGEAAALQTITE